MRLQAKMNELGGTHMLINTVLPIIYARHKHIGAAIFVRFRLQTFGVCRVARLARSGSTGARNGSLDAACVGCRHVWASGA